MNLLQKAVNLCGSQQKLADKLGSPITQAHISYWVKHGVPKKWAVRFDEATNGEITHHDLRPDIYGPGPGSKTED